MYIHIPATFSVPGFEKYVHVQSKGDPQNLFNRMVELQVKHLNKASLIMRKRFKHIFDLINVKIETGNDEIQKSKLKSILSRLSKYCDIIPVIIFKWTKI